VLGVQATQVSPPPGGRAAIMGGELPATIAAWCRMSARADITPTAIGPDSRRRSVPANPAPLDIDRPLLERRGHTPHAATKVRRGDAFPRKSPAEAGQSLLGTAKPAGSGPLWQSMSTGRSRRTRSILFHALHSVRRARPVVTSIAAGRREEIARCGAKADWPVHLTPAVAHAVPRRRWRRPPPIRGVAASSISKACEPVHPRWRQYRASSNASGVGLTQARPHSGGPSWNIQ
jgi:hypothetical protein